MPTSLNNYTITSVVYTAVSGTNVYNTHPTAVLTITPDEGYSINANDFSWTNTDLNYINTVIFTQDGNNVLCTVTFDNPFTMPAANVDLALCISGEAVISELCCDIDLEVSGGSTYYNIQTGSPIPENTIFNVCGVEGQTVTLFSRTYTCQSGYFFANQTIPSAELFVSDSNQYSVTETNTTNSDGQVTSTTISVNYTFTDKCGEGSDAYLINDKVRIKLFQPTQIQVPEIKITNYTLDTSDVGPDGCQKTMRVYGNVGATFTLESSNGEILTLPEDSGIVYSYSITPIQTIPASGYVDVNIEIPASATADQYCFTLDGDLIEPFPQINPVCINQYGKVILTFNTTGANLTVTSAALNDAEQASTTITRTYPSNSSPSVGSSNYYNTIKWTVTAAAGQAISLVSNPTVSWTNLTEYTTENTEEVQLSTTVPVAVVTGIATGMRMEAADPNAAYSVTTAGTPPVCTVSSIASNNLTVTPQQLHLPYTVAEGGSELKFSNRKGSVLELPVTATLSADQTTVTIKVNGIIEKYGDTSQTFTLDLTSLITVGSTNTCCTWTLNDNAGSAPRGGSLDFTACSGKTYTIKVPNGDSFTFCGLTTPAATYTTSGDGTVAITNAGACSANCYTYTYVYTGKTSKTTTITYIDCTGNLQNISVGNETSGNTFCGQRWDPEAADSANTTITRGGTGCT